MNIYSQGYKMQAHEPTQVELAVEYHKQKIAAEQQELAFEDVVKQARTSLDGLIEYSHQAIQSLSLVGNFAPFFDINFLKSEGHTNVDAIDQEYMRKIGQQLIKDYQTFSSEANVLSSKLKTIKDQFENMVAAVVIAARDDVMVELMANATDVHAGYIDWSERFHRIVIAAMRDIANHLNPLRAQEHQINID